MIDGNVTDGYVPGAEVRPAETASAAETTPPGEPVSPATREPAGGTESPAGADFAGGTELAADPAHDGGSAGRPDYPDETEGGYDTPPGPRDPGEVGIEALFAPSPADALPGSYPAADDAGDGGREQASGGGIEGALAGNVLAGGALSSDAALGEPRPVWNQPLGQPVIAPVDQSGPQRRQRIRDLAVDSRMRVWRRRLLLTVIAGAVFAIVFTWRLGLTAAGVVAIADTIYRSRTVASIPPGIKVTRAQRHTQRRLGRLERSGYRSLHSRPIPGSKEFIDHLVVGPAGAFAIDSEKWDWRLPVRTRNARQLWVGPDSKKDRLEHARWEAERAQSLISGNLGREIVVRPAMAIYGPKVPWDILTVRDVDVFKARRLRKYMRKRIRANGDKMESAEIDAIHQAAARVLPL
jgi:hypothetical protein